MTSHANTELAAAIILQLMSFCFYFIALIKHHPSLPFDDDIVYVTIVAIGLFVASTLCFCLHYGIHNMVPVLLAALGEALIAYLIFDARDRHRCAHLAPVTAEINLSAVPVSLPQEVPAEA